MRLSISELRFGHEHPTIDLNARHGDREADDELIGLIRRQGLLYPLLAWRDDDSGFAYVIDGNRRLDAIRKIIAADPVQAEAFEAIDPVEVRIFGGDPADLMIVSRDANSGRRPLHEVDEYELAAALSLSGMSKAEVGRRLALTPVQVNRRLALGKLAPEVREAWRAGKIGRDLAQVFALQPDVKKQAAALVAGGDRMYPHDLRKTLIGTNETYAAEVAYLGGRDAARKAGVEFTADLFDATPYVLNPAILKQAVAGKQAPELEALRAEGGWAWAARSEDVGQTWEWIKFPRTLEYTPEEQDRLAALDIEQNLPFGAEGKRSYSEINDEIVAIRTAATDRGLTPEVRARTGIVCTISREGVLTVQGRGLLMPQDEREGDRPAEEREAAQDKAATLSASDVEFKSASGEPLLVIGQVRDAMTKALAALLIENREAAAAALFATIDAGPRSGSPIILNVPGAHARKDRPTFADAMNAWFIRVPDDQPSAVGNIVAPMVNCSSRVRRTDVHDGAGVTRAGIAAVLRCMEPEQVAAFMRDAFDAAAYFSAMPTKELRRILTEHYEPLGEDSNVAGLGKMKRPELAAKCLADLKGWLPPEMRPPQWADAPPEPVDDEELIVDPVITEERRPGPGDVVVHVAPGTPPALTKAQRGALALLAIHKATAEDPVIGKIHGDQLDAQTVGSLIRLGYVDKTKRTGPGGSKAVAYFLTPTGQARAAFEAA